MLSRRTRDEIHKGFLDTWALGLGLVPLGIPFGLLITQSGFAWWWAPIFSVVIYAGSVEYLAITLVTGGASVATAAVTALMVNFRHIFYGLTYPRHLIRSRLGRIYSTYALTDESYAIVSAKQIALARANGGERTGSGRNDQTADDAGDRAKVQTEGDTDHSAKAQTAEQGDSAPLTGPRVLTVQVMAQALWIGAGITGALVGQALPTIPGLEFALVSLFIVLAIDALRAHPDMSLLVTALLCAVLGYLVAPGSMMVIALVVYLVTIVGRFMSPRADKVLTWHYSRWGQGGAH
ncbi:MAG: AzlC family ABC transporter permease [Bifidobacterium sp.]|nr:AzlC family ABC transporter permease [Bifidobacterium sp.]